MGIKTFFSKLFGGAEAPAEQQDAGAHCSCCEKGPAETEKKQRAPKASPEEQKKNLRDLEGFVEYVVKALVDYPDEVAVSNETTQDGKMIKITCRPEDRGKIIGKKGKTIIALRSLVAGAAGRLQNRVTVEVMDDDDGVKR